MAHIFEGVPGTDGDLLFKFNGQFALKNYNVEIIQNNRLKVTSTGGELFSLLEADIAEVEINGKVYNDPASAQNALQALVYNPARPTVLTPAQIAAITNGWTLVSTELTYSGKRIKKVSGFTGGTGQLPATLAAMVGKYFGPDGLVDTPAEAAPLYDLHVTDTVNDQDNANAVSGHAVAEHVRSKINTATQQINQNINEGNESLSQAIVQTNNRIDSLPETLQEVQESDQPVSGSAVEKYVEKKVKDATTLSTGELDPANDKSAVSGKQVADYNSKVTPTSAEIETVRDKDFLVIKAGDVELFRVLLPFDKTAIKQIEIGNTVLEMSTDGKVKIPLKINGSEKLIDAEGFINIDTKSGNLQKILVNGAEVDDENGTVNLQLIKQVKFNGVALALDQDGAVSINANNIEVDDTLDLESTNPVANSAVAAAVQELNSNTVFSLNASLSEDGTVATLSLVNKAGATFASADIPAGTGGGGGGSAKILLTSSLSQTLIKKGDQVVLTYAFDHVDTETAETTGLKGNITITVKSGSLITYSQSFNNLSSGSYYQDISKYLNLGTNDIYVKAEVIDADGRRNIKQSYVSVKAYEVTLRSSYSVSNNLAGYKATDMLTVPYSITGVGNKNVSLYLNGIAYKTDVVTKSGTTNNNFSISGSLLKAGKNTIQLVAELEISPELTLSSKTIYMTVFRAESLNENPRIAVKAELEEGTVLTADNHFSPKIKGYQYGSADLEYAVYTPNIITSQVEIILENTVLQTVKVDRAAKKFSAKFTDFGLKTLKIKSGTEEVQLNLDILKADIELSETADGLAHKFESLGRSNSEQNFDKWVSGNITGTFANLDWGSSGWMGDHLKLVNGAQLNIPLKIFAADIAATGTSIEFEFKFSDILSHGTLFSSLNENIGIVATTQEAKLSSSTAGRSIETKYAPDTWLKIAFVINKRVGDRLLKIYINGVLCGVEQYDINDSFVQPVPAGLLFDSSLATLYIRNIRVYDKALSNEEVLNNYIIDRPTVESLIDLYNENNVIDDYDQVSIDKLRSQGKSVMRIVGDIDLLNTTNNKKFEIPGDVYYYSSLGSQFDFVAKNVGLRIQGTSSTTYPRKNYRIYLDRASKYGTTMTIGGREVTDLKYAFKHNNIPVNLFTLKADFAESSSTHNTGLAIIINDTLKKSGILTPPQAINYDVRTGVDGVPMDVFAGANNDENRYIGKYNFNNDKASSGIVFGFEGIEGFNDAPALAGASNKCVCIEFLNNSNPLDLFQTADMSGFDEGLEFRYPEDLKWSTAETHHKTAVQRLWSWVTSCRNDGAKFKREVGDYFNVNSLTAWYALTEYFMMVDQRAKNMMLATWDGLIWYFIPYDNDTILGVRNDGKLIYDYDITEETFDDSINSYAYAGHDSVLWALVRQNLMPEVQNAAQLLRSNMSKEYVLEVMNDYLMNNWSERIYNVDGAYKYIEPLLEDGINYLASLQGNRAAHRQYMIENRFALLDAKYLAGTYRADNLRVYFSHTFSADPKNIRITAAAKYYFGYGFTSGAPKQSGVYADKEDSQISLTLNTDLIVNDPQFIYGASRIKEVDLSTVSRFIVNDLNFNNCKAVRKINVSSVPAQTTLTGINVSGCKLLSSLNVNGLKGSAFTSLDLTQNDKMLHLDAHNTNLSAVLLPDGAAINDLKLPSTITSLILKNMPQLTNAGLQLQGYSAVKQLVVENCPLFDWEILFAQLTNLTHIRITGINKTGDGSWLNKFLNLKGLDENGNTIPYPALIGKYKLTLFPDDLESLKTIFPLVEFEEPEFTKLKLQQGVKSPSVLSNMDNKTGYEFGNTYVPNGHITKILSKRKHVLGKVVDGVMHYTDLHKQNANFYADAVNLSDCTPALLDGSQGDWFVYEPGYWSRVLHYEGQTEIYISTKKEKPTAGSREGNIVSSVPYNSNKLSSFQIHVDESRPYSGYFVNDAPTLAASFVFTSTSTSGAVVSFRRSIPQGYKRLMVSHLFKYGASILFTDENHNIIRKGNSVIHRDTNEYKTVILDIPEGATNIFFTAEYFGVTYAVPADVIFTNNDDNLTFAEDWEFREDTYVGATLASYTPDEKLKTIKKPGGKPLVNVSLGDCKRWVENRQGINVLNLTQATAMNWSAILALGVIDTGHIVGRTVAETLKTDTLGIGFNAHLGMAANSFLMNSGISPGYYKDGVKTAMAINFVGGYEFLLCKDLSEFVSEPSQIQVLSKDKVYPPTDNGIVVNKLTYDDGIYMVLSNYPIAKPLAVSLTSALTPGLALPSQFLGVVPITDYTRGENYAGSSQGLKTAFIRNSYTSNYEANLLFLTTARSGSDYDTFVSSNWTVRLGFKDASKTVHVENVQDYINIKNFV